MARKIRDLRRKSRSRSPKRKITILCEGRNTEPDYFRAIRKLFQGALIDVLVIPGVGVPATIAEKAIAAARDGGLIKGQRKKRDSYERHDQVWAVFDRDDHPRFEESFDRCTANSIGIAYSVPCFEIWLILHYDDLDRPDHRHDVQKRLAELCDEYDANSRKTADFDQIVVDQLSVAEQRAAAQLERRVQEGSRYGPPSTTVHKLTQAIREAAQIKSKSGS